MMANEWKFTQSFGETKENNVEVNDADMITAVEFDKTGNYLSVGDRSGRIWIFEGHVNTSQTSLSLNKKKKFEPIEYVFYSQFQSHEPEFDCLKSLEIEERINMIEWCNNSRNNYVNPRPMLLTTNDKTIKLWRLHEKRVTKLSEMNVQPSPSQNNSVYNDDFSNIYNNNNQSIDRLLFSDPSSSSFRLKLPKVEYTETFRTATIGRIFANAHAYHINSISLNSDGETFISADDLRVNLWHLDYSDRSFNIIDIKPYTMEELIEVICVCRFHPQHCNILMHASSKGTIRLGDLRDAALCERHAKVFEIEQDLTSQTFFSEISSSIADAAFTPDGRYIFSRDYMTLKIWDISMERRPLHVIPIHEYLRPKLSELYDNDCIFDKFTCACSGDGTQFLTGSYNENFHIYDWPSNTSIMIESGKAAPKIKKPSKTTKQKDGKFATPEILTPPINVEKIKMSKKALSVAWHPTANAVAIAGLNNLYLYQS